MLHGHPGGGQGRGGFGEGGCDDRRLRGAQVAQQGEALGRPGERQHLVAGSAVPPGGRVLSPLRVRDAGVARQVGEPIRQPPQQPVRRLPVPDVDGEIQHPGLDGLIAVIARRRGARAESSHP